jgi:hypothetical protein
MSPEHLADSQIQGYLCIKLDLGLLVGLTLRHVHQMMSSKTTILLCLISSQQGVSSAVNKVYHHLVDHSHSRNRVTIQQTVTMLQQIVIMFPQTVITLSKDIRLVRELVNRGQNVANALYIVQHFRKSLQRFFNIC